MNKQQITQIQWKEIELKELGTIVTGNTPSMSKPEYYGGTLPWVKTPDLDKNKYITQTQDYISDIGKNIVRVLPAGSVMVSCIGNIGKVGIAGCEVCTNQQINSIVPNPNIILPEYLYYSVLTNGKSFADKATTAVVPLLNKTEFSKLKIPIPYKDNKPDLETQQRIVEKLELAEKLKENRKKADELTKEYLNSVFLEMFGDPRSNPKGFEVKKLIDISEIIMGQSPPGESYNEERNGIPFFQGKSEFTEKYPIVKKWTTEPTKYAKNNDILMSVRAPVGSVNLSNIIVVLVGVYVQLDQMKK